MTKRGLRMNVNPVDDYADYNIAMAINNIANTNKCPHCGESYYQVLYSTSTCLHWTPVYKDGVMISENPNKTTNHCHCLGCDKDFSYQS